MSNIDLRLFDVSAYLEDIGVEIFEDGKNISEGWIGIECPYCDDSSNHLGINLYTKLFTCWKCAETGSATNLIMEFEDIPYYKALERLTEYQDPYYLRSQVERKLKVSGDILCKEASKDFHSEALKYLKTRNFEPNEIIPKFDLYCTNHLGKYKFRIIIPVIINGEIVGFTTRDFTDKADKRYLKCSIEESSVNHKEWLYNIDSVKDTVIIVEGPTDVWRLGDGCISTLTSQFSNSQIEILVERKIKHAYLLFDTEYEAQKKAEKMANNISAFVSHVEVLSLQEGDPADLTNEEAKELLSEIL